ncbi:MAG: TetR/AcrR family transcriptional regulator [Sterolibacterium sp.]|nr:TetR/AcrR family transcriptional regulator [Sterolibacterium sp.]
MKIQQASKVQNRAQLQCDRILNAAEQCFIKHGFHAASMANIAEAAQMSAGLIYRYFENKNAIILAIIERQLRIMSADIATLHSGTDLIPLIMGLFASWQSGNPKGMNPALFLEMAAHATRDSQIDQAMTNADQIGATVFSSWLKRLAKTEGRDLTDTEVQRCVFFMRCFIEGLAVRAVREPKLDPSLVAESLRLFLPHLLSFSQEVPGSGDKVCTTM